MAAHAARRLLPMAENAAAVLAIELLAAARAAISTRRSASSPPLERVRALVRRGCRIWTRTAISLPTSQAAIALVRSGRVVDAAGAECLPPSRETPHDRLPSRLAEMSPRRGPRSSSASRTPGPTSRPLSSRSSSRPGSAAQGHGLAHRAALRLRRRAGRDTSSAHAVSRTRHRRQPRPLRRLALSRPGHDRAMSRPRPSTASRSTGLASSPTRAEIATPPAPPISTPTSRARRRARARCATLHRASSSTIATRSAPVVPRLFDGELPVLQPRHQRGPQLRPANLRATVVRDAAPASGFSLVANGRFKGGWITRHYGEPERRRPRRPDGARLPRLHATRPGRGRGRAGTAGRGEAYAAADPPRPSRRCWRSVCLRDAALRPNPGGRRSEPRSMRRAPEDHTMTRIDNARVIRAPRGTELSRQELADRSAAAHADEQPRSRGRRAPGGAGRLRRHRPGGARLGELRPHRRDAARARRPTRRCWSSRASRSASSARTPMRRAC